MKASKEKIEYSKFLTQKTIAMQIAKKYNISYADALSRFMRTKTYSLLQDSTSYLWSESDEYVWDMLVAETNGNVEEWLKI